MADVIDFFRNASRAVASQGDPPPGLLGGGAAVMPGVRPQPPREDSIARGAQLFASVWQYFRDNAARRDAARERDRNSLGIGAGGGALAGATALPRTTVLPSYPPNPDPFSYSVNADNAHNATITHEFLERPAARQLIQQLHDNGYGFARNQATGNIRVIDPARVRGQALRPGEVPFDASRFLRFPGPGAMGGPVDPSGFQLVLLKPKTEPDDGYAAGGSLYTSDTSSSGKPPV